MIQFVKFLVHSLKITIVKSLKITTHLDIELEINDVLMNTKLKLKNAHKLFQGKNSFIGISFENDLLSLLLQNYEKRKPLKNKFH